MATVTITFHIPYQTKWGETLHIIFAKKSMPLTTKDGYNWEIQQTFRNTKKICYHYAVHLNKKTIREEPSCYAHNIEPDVIMSGKEVSVYDSWIEENHFDRPLQSSALKECIYKPISQDCLIHPKGTTRFHMHAQPFKKNKNWIYAILGNQDEAGNWNEEKAIPLTYISEYFWATDIQIRQETTFEYKYVIWDKNCKKVIEWEKGNNRTLKSLIGKEILKDDGIPQFKSNQWKGAGIVIPIFSLRSNTGFGIGDFGDLYRLIDWASSVHMSCIQILPINDTTRTHTWKDSYPYNSISVFALHPIYLDIRQLNISLTSEQETERNRLNALSEIDYEGVEKLKKGIIEKFLSEKKEEILQSAEYCTFYKENQKWLLPYATFCYYRELNHTANFRDWPNAKSYSTKAFNTLIEKSQALNDIENFCVMQYLLFTQMRRAHRHARQKQIILKGDIPIGISRDSVPAWVDRRLFNFNGQAGAPPDAFAPEGQNWGFPTYRWDVMQKDHYKWWKSRLHIMSNFFDAYRIDHVLGFFRIWQIPYKRKDGLLGHFVPALPFCKKELQEKGIILRDETIFKIPEKIDMDYHKAMFIEDEDTPGYYHPCIGGRESIPYQAMTQEEQHAYDSIYEDYFYHRHNSFWGNGALKKLQVLINTTQMLPCAEDLGMVPQCVKPVLNTTQILSLEIERMPKEIGQTFANTALYPYLSVATISTHDMPPLRLWWKQYPELAQEYYNNILHKEGKISPDLSSEDCEKIICSHLNSPSILCLLSFQDWTSIDDDMRYKCLEKEQINVPSNPNQYWQYRMHISLDALITNSAFNEKILNLIIKYKR